MAVALLSAVAAAEPPGGPVHAVVLLEDNADLLQVYRRLQIPTLGTGDRIAIVTFSKRTTVRMAFTNDRRELERVLQRVGMSTRMGFSIGYRSPSSEVRVFEAVRMSAELFAKLPASQDTKRLVIVVFGSDDYSAKPDATEIRRALDPAHAGLLVAPANLIGFRPPPVPVTPPTIPGSSPGRNRVQPLPDAAIRVLKAAGAIVKDHPDLEIR